VNTIGAGLTATGKIVITDAPATTPPAQAYSITLSAAPSTVIVGGNATLTATVNPQNGAPAPTSFAWDCDGNGTVDFTSRF